MSYMSKLTAALPALGLGALLAAGPASAQDVNLDVLYAQPGFARYHDPVAQVFMAKHPNIKISFRAPAANYDEGHQAMMRQSITNQLPDIYIPGFHLLEELTNALSKRNQILELEALYNAEPAEWQSANYTESMINLGKVNGKLYGLPVNASLPIMYFNSELVKKAGGDPQRMPDTWDGVIALAKKIRETSPGIAGVGYAAHDWPDDWLFRAMIHQSGGKMLDPSGNKAGFDGEPGKKALEHFRRLVTEGGMPLIDFDSARAQFTAGQMGIHFDTPARLRVISDQIGNKFTLGTEVFPIDNKASGGIPTGGSAIVITAKDPTKQKAAWEYAKFLTGPEAQKIVVEVTGYLPTNKLAAGPQLLGPFYQANPHFATAARQTDRAVPWQGYPGGNSVRVWRTQREIITGVMRGEITPEAGLERLVKETNALIK